MMTATPEMRVQYSDCRPFDFGTDRLFAAEGTHALVQEFSGFERTLRAIARQDDNALRLMTTPDIVRRAGPKKARVALARKLAVVLHRLLRDRTNFVAHKGASAVAA